MPNTIRNIHTREEDAEHSMVVDLNIDIPLPAVRGHIEGLVRGNLYRNKTAVEDSIKQPVLITYAPYGKDIPYQDFNKRSYADLPEEHKSKWSAWEVPEPTYWTKHGYCILRVDERGFGQSPGFADTMSSQTASDFASVIEWASEQEWCNGKVGLLGISYYGGSQWRVAAHKPKGLVCMLPWEGMSDYYRDRTKHGGISSNKFVDFWWYRQVATNLYGVAGKASRKWGPDTIEGDLTEEEIKANRVAQPDDLAKYKYLSEPYFTSRDYDLKNIEIPCLSVGNWGGILLHLRGNVEGYTHIGSKQKWLRFITGRHDIPFYLPEYVALQRSFLDAFLLDDDREGWKEGKVAPVNICIRKGNPGFNKTEAERTFPFRDEAAWPLPSTQYTKWHFNAAGELGPELSATSGEVTYPALDSEKGIVHFRSAPAKEETEITGHIVLRTTVSVSSTADGNVPKDLDLFVTLRHYDSAGEEVFYTGTAGDPVPLCKGWLRCSFRKVNTDSPLHRPYLPRREYREEDVEFLKPEQRYTVDVEVWPTNVVLSEGDVLEVEIASADTQGSAMFQHNLESDRSVSTFGGNNHIHFGPNEENYLLLPIIPKDPKAVISRNSFATGGQDGANENGQAPLNVIVVGAGLGGMACAAALRKYANVTVYEVAPALGEIGAAVHLAPNAHRIIQSWGGELSKVGCVANRHVREWTPAGEIKIDAHLDPLTDHGSEWMLCHRVDFHKELIRLATSEEFPGKPAKLVLGELAVSCDPKLGTITLQNGMMISGDVVIGADGIKSIIRESVLEKPIVAVPSQHSAYRMLVPAEKINALPELASLGLLEPRITIVHDNERRLIMYPCRNGSLLNFVCCLPDSELNEISEEKWTAEGSREHLVESFKTFAPMWQKLLSLGPAKPGLYQLRDQDPLPEWVKGRVIIIGDSAHPVLPHQGQGASAAIEDAEALGAFLEGVSRAGVNEALRRVFNVRYKRASYIQHISRASGLGEMRRSKLPTGDILPETLNPLQFSKFCWEYYGAKRWEKEEPTWIVNQ